MSLKKIDLKKIEKKAKQKEVGYCYVCKTIVEITQCPKCKKWICGKCWIDHYHDSDVEYFCKEMEKAITDNCKKHSLSTFPFDVQRALIELHRTLNAYIKRSEEEA